MIAFIGLLYAIAFIVDDYIISILIVFVPLALA